MALGTLPAHVRRQRFAAGAFPRRLRAWRDGIISLKARRRRNYRSRSELCKSGSRIELRHAVLPEPQSKKPFVRSAARSGLLATVAIRESRIALRWHDALLTVL